MSLQLSGLLISLAMEVPLALALALGLKWVAGTDWRRLLGVAIGTTLLTHPVAWWGYRGLRGALEWERWPAFALVEICVTLAEAAMYWRLARITPLRALILALAVNAASAFWGSELAIGLGLR